MACPMPLLLKVQPSFQFFKISETMRKVQLLSLFILGNYVLPAQSIYYNDFQGLSTHICVDSSGPVIQVLPDGWIIYQTTNGNWDGPVDSTRCISADAQVGANGSRIDLEQIDPAQPLFIRATAEELNLNSSPLAPNALYNLFACASLDGGAVSQFLTGSNCAQDVCTGAFVGIAIPDSNGAPGLATRFHTALASENQLHYCFESCFPSEYFDDQRLRELVLKFSFAPATDLTGRFLHLSYITIQQGFELPGFITEVLAYPQQFANGEYAVNVSEAANNPAFFNQNYLALHEPFTYPDAQHETYIEGRPVPNTSDSRTIKLVVDQYQTLEIQPFTNFRGAKVLGSDSVRHTLHLVNNGGEVCMNFLDLIFGGADEYQHGGGTVSMHNAFSCMQFHDKSALRVQAGATLHYGLDGAGMLLLCPGSTIALERDATLYFDARLVLSECNESALPQQIYMDLPPGARLVFTENAHVTNQFSHQQQMQLNVRMLGGTLDDSALAPNDQAVIQRIWPAPASRMEDNIGLFPNPFSVEITLQYLAGAPEEIHLVWTNLRGQIVGTELLQAMRGPNQWQPKLPEAAGMYLVTLQGTAGKCTKKVVRMAP